ncbi:site-2 protease family protein [Fibrobacterota bacterium]
MPEFSFSLVFQIITQVVVGMVGLSFLVFIHEAGHFLMAKKMGVRVNMFSIGFGKTLFSIKRGDTEYCIKSIPFGGFVAMAGEQPDDERKGSADEFPSKPVPARMAIATAGPAVNIAFAFLALTALYLVGIQEPVSNEITVGQVLDDSPADIAGIKEGDKITALGGKPLTSLEKFLQDVAVEAGNTLIVTLDREGKEFELSVTPVMHEMGFAWIGLIPGQTSVQVSSLLPGKPASRSGFQKGDRIVSAQGVAVPDPNTFVEIINASKGEEIVVMISRQEEELAFFVTPEKDRESGKFRIGMGISMVYNVPTHLVKRNLTESLVKSFQVNADYSLTMFRFLSGIFSGSIKLKALSGPVGILQVIGNSFRKSFQKFIEFMALISLNLGLINLLPLIITDGGVILFLSLEAVRRKPLTVKTQMRINQIAISFFIALALIITFHDILKIPLFLD